MLDFADVFERELVHQAGVRRTVAESLDTGLALLQRFALEG
jgi:vacuolar-type H+-ATPase subunit B/Vma2